MRIQQPRYSMLIQWSDEDQKYIVSLPEWGPYAHTHGDTYEEAARKGQELLEFLIQSAEEEARAPLPTPALFNDHAYTPSDTDRAKARSYPTRR